MKIKAAEEFLSGNGSRLGICRKYEISSYTQLQEWIKVSHGHKKLKELHGSGTEIYMTKGRKTTQQERAEIVSFCIEHGKDCPQTIEKYGVSYLQIYS